MADSSKRPWYTAILLLFGRNKITAMGAGLATATALAIVFFLVKNLFGAPHTPYIGLVIFLFLPALFVLGLLLIPLGIRLQHHWDAKAAKARGEEHPTHPHLDFNKASVRRALGIVIGLTAANIFIVSALSYQGTHYMESTEFCGTTCHVMSPEFTAFQESPHAALSCARCHIGPGVESFIQSKIAGVEQIYGVVTGNYPTPIPTPVHNLRPAREICQTCHINRALEGEKFQMKTIYSPDEENTPLTTAVIFHYGGPEFEREGIHSYHNNLDRRIEFYTDDEDMNVIPYVRVTEPDGSVKEYFADGAEIDPATLAEEDLHVMDCIDCHNRPTHIYDLPGPGLDKAMLKGQVDPSLPYIKMVGLEALNNIDVDSEDQEQIAEHIRSYYQENYPELYESDTARIEESIEGVVGVYNKNVFPHMDITWGTYEDRIGHFEFEQAGCFRCHDSAHSTRDGEHMIEQDCTACHAIVAWEEYNPTILETLGRPLE